MEATTPHTMLQFYPESSPSSDSECNPELRRFDLHGFATRLKRLYTYWEEHRSDIWGGADAISLAPPPVLIEIRYPKSLALSRWLFGFDILYTITVFSANHIRILCPRRYVPLLSTVVESVREAVGAEVTIFCTDCVTTAGEMELILQSLSDDRAIVGYVADDVPEGWPLVLWDSKLRASNLQLVDISDGVAGLLAVKDDEEILKVREGSISSAHVMNSFVVPKLRTIIDGKMEVCHRALICATERAIRGLSKHCWMSYFPVFQSGGRFDFPFKLDVRELNTFDENLYYEPGSVIVCAVGVNYKDYCSSVARTFLIDATPRQRKAYGVLLKAHQAAIGALKPGNKASCAYAAAVAVVRRDAPGLLAKMTRSAGEGIGLELREYLLSLNAENSVVLRPGMTFNVSLGFEDLLLSHECDDPRLKKFSLLIGDTVIVCEEGPVVATSGSSKDVVDVAYPFFNVSSEPGASSGDQERQ